MSTRAPPDVPRNCTDHAAPGIPYLQAAGLTVLGWLLAAAPAFGQSTPDCAANAADVDADTLLAKLTVCQNQALWLYRLGARLIEEQRSLRTNDDDRIFPFNHRSISSRFTRSCQELDIQDLHFHDLRHEGTSRLFEAGFQIQQVALVTGHKDWKMLRRYTHIRPEALHEEQDQDDGQGDGHDEGFEIRRDQHHAFDLAGEQLVDRAVHVDLVQQVQAAHPFHHREPERRRREQTAQAEQRQCERGAVA